PHDNLGGASRFLIGGPVIHCREQAMNGIALIFHELATNATKYGALADARGGVEIAWRREGDDVVLSWAEHGGPPITQAPEKDGFGGALVRSTVVGQLGG